MASSRGKKTAVLSGLALGALVIVGGLLWEDIVFEYYLRKLRGNPDFLVDFFEAPFHSAQAKAARAYLRTPEGRRGLVHHFLSNLAPNHAFLEADVKGAMFGFDGKAIWGQERHPDDTTVFAYVWSTSPRLTEVLREIAADAEGTTFTLPRYPGLQFAILPVHRAAERCGNDLPSWVSESVCVVRGMPGAISQAP